MESSQSNELSRAEIERRLDALPLLPVVVLELALLDPNAEDFSKRVVDAAQKDPGLAARILSVANSVSSAPARQIVTIRDAVVRLGARRVSALTTSFALLRVFVPSQESQRDLWRHAQQVAIAGEVLAREAGTDVDPQQAFLCGLLHDIGRFVLFEHDGAEFGDPAGPDWSQPPSLIAGERARAGFDHADVGQMICRAWSLPESLARVVREHHDYAAVPATRSAQSLLRLVQQADCVGNLLLRSPEVIGLAAAARASRLERAAVCPAWSRPPLSAERMAPLLDEIDARSRKQIAALGLEARAG